MATPTTKRPQAPMRRRRTLHLGLCLALTGVLLAGGGLYALRQGCFDAPLVRFARAMSANDADSVAFAKVLVADRSAAWEIPWFDEAVGWQFEPDELPDAIAVTHAMSVRHLPHMADFDWKDGGEPVAEAFEAMLAHHGLALPDPAQRRSILDEAEAFGSDYTQIPILIARYDAYFRRHGYVLALINTGSDAYEFVALPPATARCWLNAALEAEPGRQYDTTVHIEEAILQSGEYVAARMPELRELVPDQVPLKHIPGSACLPWQALLP